MVFFKKLQNDFASSLSFEINLCFVFIIDTKRKGYTFASLVQTGPKSHEQNIKECGGEFSHTPNPLVEAHLFEAVRPVSTIYAD